jgi:excisionase family DNA binding protein
MRPGLQLSLKRKLAAAASRPFRVTTSCSRVAKPPPSMRWRVTGLGTVAEAPVLNFSSMLLETLPQHTDYQRAIYETLCRIESVLRGNQHITRGSAHTPLLTIDEAAKALRISRSTMKQLIGHGVIRVIHIGRRVLVAQESLERFLNDQP